MSWIFLFLAIIGEVCATTCMKLSKGFTDIKYGIIMIFLYIFSFSMLTLALKRIPIGLAYAIWSGIGIIFIFTIGLIVFKEPINIAEIGFIVLIIIGVVGLNLTSKVH